MEVAAVVGMLAWCGDWVVTRVAVVAWLGGGAWCWRQWLRLWSRDGGGGWRVVASDIGDRIDRVIRNVFGVRRKSSPKKFSAAGGGSGGGGRRLAGGGEE
nr:hypothetical protein [Tanacetum cinerariifolium]